jgi:hypothetical protein
VGFAVCKLVGLEVGLGVGLDEGGGVEAGTTVFPHLFGRQKEKMSL